MWGVVSDDMDGPVICHGHTQYCMSSKFVIFTCWHSTQSSVKSSVLVCSVRTSQETHYVSATKPNRLMLFEETVAVYCENHAERTDALCRQNAEF
jgi:hypothetical protein